MQGRCTSTRALATMVGLAAAVGMTTTAIGQNVIGIDSETINNQITFDGDRVGAAVQPGIFRTLTDALESGLYDNVDGVVEEPGVARGVSPADCVMDAACVQPNDNITGFNAAAFSTAETITVDQTGFLSQFCAQFIFAPGGACPPTTTDPSLALGWSLDMLPVNAMGDPLEGSVANFDTDTLGNLTVANAAGGVFGGAFQIVNIQMNLGTLAGQPMPGFPVSSGDCIAINPQWLGFGGGCGNFFWASSSNVADGSASGDGLVLFDQSGTDDWDICEYVDNDLMICVDVLASAPFCSPDFSTPASNDECDNPQPIACDTVFTQCIRFNTDNTMEDPPFECETTGGLDNTFTGLNTSWYSVTSTNSRVRFDTCNLDGDPNLLIQIFTEGAMPGEGVGPCNLVLVQCSDNDCQFGASVCLNDIPVGQDYIIMVAAATSFDAVNIELSVTCDEASLPPAPANDECINAEQIFASPMPGPFEVAGVSGSTECSGLDPIATSCAGTTTGLSGGNWYTAVGDGTMWLISQCIPGGGDADFQLNVYCGDCNLGLVCLGGNDDSVPCPPQSEFMFCTEMGREYFFYVHGFFDVGNYGIEFTADADFMGGCTPMTPQDELCQLVELDCMDILGGAPDIMESTDADALMEMCGNDVNNGCTSLMAMGTSAPFIEAGMLPFTACGEINAENNNRDLDSYKWTISERSLVTVDVIAEFDPVIFMSDSDDCDNNNALGAFAALAGTNLNPTFVLNPGTYLSVISVNAFSGVPCGSGNDYVLQVTAEPIGRCCIEDMAGLGVATFSECCVTTMAQCEDLGGTFDGGIDCGPITYDVSMVQNAPIYASIIGLANEVVIDGEEEDAVMMDPFMDEDAEFVDIRGDDSELLDAALMATSLDFKFYGELRDDIAVISNGYLTFPRGGVGIISAAPAEIPTAGTDGTNNDFIAALWRDLDPSAATIDSANGFVSMVIQGAAPSRTLTVEYQFVPDFNNAMSSNNFQIQIFEGSNIIRFLYNDIEDQTAVTDDGMGNITRNVAIGVENQTGSVGSGLDDMTIDGLSTAGFGSSDALFVDFTPVAEFSAQEACTTTVMPTCLGDCDDSGAVNFGDLVAMLFEFGTPGSVAGCDADESGTVNFGDLVAALFLFGPCP